MQTHRHRKPDWQQIIDSADIRIKCEAMGEVAEDRLWNMYDRHLRSVYGNRVKRLGERSWTLRV